MAPRDLPDDYLPGISSYYAFTPIDNIDLYSISQKYSSGIMDIHLNGQGVNYGGISFSKISTILPQIEDMIRSMSNKFIKYTKQHISNINETTKKELINSLRLDTSYEYLCPLMGSIRIILRPINPQISQYKTYSDDFAEEVIELLKSGYNKDCIISYSEKYGKNTIKKYNDLICSLNSEGLSMGIAWCNKNANILYRQSIKHTELNYILSNLSDFEFNNKEEYSVSGKFYSINTKSGAYSFESIEGDDFKSTGYFDSDRKQMAYTISFNKTYKVLIERKASEKVGSKINVKDIIKSFIEENN